MIKARQYMLLELFSGLMLAIALALIVIMWEIL